MNYLKSFNESLKSLTEEDINTIKDIFLDIKDEYSLEHVSDYIFSKNSYSYKYIKGSSSLTININSPIKIDFKYLINRFKSNGYYVTSEVYRNDGGYLINITVSI